MWSFQQNIFKTRTITSIPTSNTFEVGEGDCNNIPTVWSTVYSVSNVPLSNGDILFTDSLLTTFFNGGNNTHRARTGGAIVTNQEFDISTIGVVNNTTTCDIIINEEQEELANGGCTTCASITVPVPSGETRQVEFIKSGIGPYGSPGSLCSNTGTAVVANNTFNITSNTTYNFGIDATRGSTGTNTATTTISVIIRDNGTILDTYTLSRSHRDPVINC